MTLIAFLLSLLLLGVTGLPTPDTALSIGNVTNVLDFNPDPPCSWTGSIQDQMPGDCRCWAFWSHNNEGADRTWMVEAITKACSKFANGKGEPMAQYGLASGLDQGRTSWYYKDGYKIAISLHVWNYLECSHPTSVSYDYCWDSLHAPLDACNTGGVNGKWGGYQKWYVLPPNWSSCCIADTHRRGCLTWILDASPDDHWPYTQRVLN